MPPTYSTTRLPDVIGQDYESQRIIRTRRTPFDSTIDQAQPMSGNNILWAFKIGWQYLSQTVAEQLLAAYQFVGGPTAGIYWFDWVPQTWTSVVVGTGTGAQLVFDLPVTDATAGTTSMYVNSVLTTAGTFQSKTGPNGEDRFAFTAAPGNGLAVTANFTGRRRRKVRITSFKLSARQSSTSLWTASLDLVETEGTGQ